MRSVPVVFAVSLSYSGCSSRVLLILLTSVVKNSEGEVIEGSATAVKRQKDVWTYARRMGSDDPNWQLVATDE